MRDRPALSPLSRLDLEGLIADVKGAVLILDGLWSSACREARPRPVREGYVELCLTDDQHVALDHAHSLAFKAMRDLATAFYSASSIGGDNG